MKAPEPVVPVQPVQPGPRVEPIPVLPNIAPVLGRGVSEALDGFAMDNLFDPVALDENGIPIAPPLPV